VRRSATESPEERVCDECAGVVEGSLDYFNRYIAGDR